MMKTYIWVTFAFLGWGYYEASGGADFRPGSAQARPVADVAEAAPAEPRPAMAYDATTPRGRINVKHRVEAALLVALRNAPETRDGAAEGMLHAVAFSDNAATDALAPTRPVAMDTSTPARPSTNTDANDEQAATVSAPKTSPRPQMRPDTQIADAGTPRISSRSGAEPGEAGHVITVPRANLRVGPGTNFPVLDVLEQGNRVRVLRKGADGWVKLKGVDHGRIGWMAGYLLAGG